VSGRDEGYIRVRVGGRAYGLPLGPVLEVADLGEVLDVPRSLPSVRGLTPARGRLVPLIHLGALLANQAPPAERGAALVLVELRGRLVALEVDDADEVVREAPLAVPPGEALPWAQAMGQRDGGLIPILDLEALGERIQ